MNSKQAIELARDLRSRNPHRYYGLVVVNGDPKDVRVVGPRGLEMLQEQHPERHYDLVVEWPELDPRR